MKRITKERIFYLVSAVVSFISLCFTIDADSFDYIVLIGIFEIATPVLLIGTIACATLELLPHEAAKTICKSSWYRLTRIILPVLAGVLVIPATVLRGFVTDRYKVSYNTTPCLLVFLTSVLIFFVAKKKQPKPAPTTMAEIIKRRNTPKKSIRLVSLIIIFILFCILLITHVIFWFNDTLVNEIWVDYSNRANPVTGFNAGYYSSIGVATCGEIFEVSLRGSDYGYDYSGYVGDGFTLALSTNQGRKNIEEFKVSSSNEDVVEFDGEKFILKSSGTATIEIKKHFTKLEYTVKVFGADKIGVSVPRSATEIVKGEKTLVGVDFPSYYSYHDAEKMFDFKISPSASATLTIEKMWESTISVYVTAQEVGEFYLDMYYEDERIASAEFTVTDK